MRIKRFPQNPIITPHMDGRMGDNINGPSLIRLPDWVENKLGRYYLYFAHHDGRYIRLAYSDTLEGPWKIYTPGVLPLEESRFAGHIASPDLIIDHENQQIRMYYHGCDEPTGSTAPQPSRVAISTDGLHFEARPESVEHPYFRVFRWGGYYYVLSMPGIFYRSKDGLTDFELGPTLFTEDMRHTAVMVDDDTLTIFYTNAGDRPECILMSEIDLSTDWHNWTPSEPTVILKPEHRYEGADMPLVPSERGAAAGRLHQLRDPAIYREGGRIYLLYAVAGESGIAIAEILRE